MQGQELHQRCTEQIIEAYTTGHFEPIFPFMADDIELHSFWVREPRKGKAAVTEYYTGKGKTLRNSDTEIYGYSVITEAPLRRKSNVILYIPKGTVCAMLSQTNKGKKTWIIILPGFNEQGLLSEISIHDPQFFNFRPLNAYD